MSRGDDVRGGGCAQPSDGGVGVVRVIVVVARVRGSLRGTRVGYVGDARGGARGSDSSMDRTRAGREALAGGGARGVFDARRRRTPRQVRPRAAKNPVRFGDGRRRRRSRRRIVGLSARRGARKIGRRRVNHRGGTGVSSRGGGRRRRRRVVRVPAGARSRSRRRERRRASGRVGERVRRRRRRGDGAPRRHRRAPVDGVRVVGGVESGFETRRRRGCFVGEKTNRRRTRRRDGDTSRRGRLRGCRRRFRVSGIVRERGERPRRRGASRRRRGAPLARRTEFIVVGKNFPRRDASSLGENGPRARARGGGYRAMERKERDGPRDETNSSERRGRGRGRRKAFGGRSRTRVGVGFGVLGGLDASRARLGRRDGGVFGDGADGFFAGPVGRRQRCRRGSPSRADGGERGSIVGGVARARDASRGDASTDTRGVLRSGTVRVVAMRANPASTRAHARRDGRARRGRDVRGARRHRRRARGERTGGARVASRATSNARGDSRAGGDQQAETRDGPFPSLRTRRRGRSLGVHPPAFAHARVRDGRVDVVVVVRVR